MRADGGISFDEIFESNFEPEMISWYFCGNIQN